MQTSTDTYLVTGYTPDDLRSPWLRELADTYPESASVLLIVHYTTEYESLMYDAGEGDWYFCIQDGATPLTYGITAQAGSTPTDDDIDDILTTWEDERGEWWEPDERDEEV